MKTYTISIDFEVAAASAEGALEEMQLVIGNAIDTLNDAKMGEHALILESAVYAEPYPDTDCVYDHDHTKGGCEVHD